MAVMTLPSDLAVFVRAVESGGFTAAARTFGLTPSAVSKLITRMETRLGVRLLNRTTRRVHPTAEGERFFQRAQRILADLEEAESELTSSLASPRGLLRMHVSVAFGLHQLAPMLPTFAARYPEIELMLDVSDRVVDLVDEGVDIAVRIGPLPDSTLVARHICDIERVICAAPAYLKRRGTPKTPEDLLAHDCLRLFTQPALSHWPFKDPQTQGGVRTLEIQGRFSANNAESLRQMAIDGLGIVRLTDLTVGSALQSGALRPILTDVNHIEPVPLSALMPPGKQRLPKVSAMVDFLVEHFASAPWRRSPPPALPRADRRLTAGTPATTPPPVSKRRGRRA